MAARFTVAFQRSADTVGDAPGTTPPWTVTTDNGQRVWHEIPNKTEFLEVTWTANGPGSIAIETISKKNM